MDAKRDTHTHEESDRRIASHWLKQREDNRFKYQFNPTVASEWFIKDPLEKSSPSIDGCISDKINGYPDRLTPGNKAGAPSHFHPIAPPQGPIKPIHWAYCSNTEAPLKLVCTSIDEHGFTDNAETRGKA